MADITASIFDIQHFSLHDGPGVRSTVFFKGCPLSCWWCGNPESQSAAAELLFFRNLCVECGSCAVACPEEALEIRPTGLIMDHGLCSACGACVAICQYDARQVSGRRMTVDQVCAEVRQHWRIFQQSGGGVTLSGGEALQQHGFIFELLRSLHDDAGLHTCLDTCGMAPWSVLECLLPYLDMVLLDIKHMDGKAHERATGADNVVILENARQLAKKEVPVLIRLPLIPAFNDTNDNLQALGVFLHETGLKHLEIMPYHTLGLNKYTALGRKCVLPEHKEIRVEAAAEILSRYGLCIEIHGAGM